jgi:hypothetical protein
LKERVFQLWSQQSMCHFEMKQVYMLLMRELQILKREEKKLNGYRRVASLRHMWARDSR